MANQYFTCTLDAWVKDDTIHARMHYYRVDGQTYTYSDSSFPAPTMTIAGQTFSDTDFANRVHSGIAIGSVYTTEFTKKVATNGNYAVSFAAGSGVRSDFAGTWNTTVTVSLPSNLSLANLTSTADSITATVSVSDWGGVGDATTRYLELSLCLGQSISQRRYNKVFGNSLTAGITVDDNAEYHTGTIFEIAPNTRYYATMYATNGTQGTGNSNFYPIVTRAKLTSASLISVEGDTATIAYETAADGGYYSKDIQYSLDEGIAWITATTIATGAATSGTFAISGLSGTQTIKIRILTGAGASETIDIIVQITGINGVAPNGKKMAGGLCSVNGIATKITGALVSINGVASKA